jgi:hypothetical protein
MGEIVFGYMAFPGNKYGLFGSKILGIWSSISCEFVSENDICQKRITKSSPAGVASVVL